MTEETYSFVQDNKARKQLAYSARKKVRGKSKYVNMPSDYLSAKERKELNGTVATYEMDKPHRYHELLAFPKDIRKEYLQGVVDKYHPSIIDVQKMLRCNRENTVNLLKSLEIDMPRTYRNPTQKFEWRVFMGENITPPEPEPAPVEERTPVAKPVQEQYYSMGIGEIDHLSIHVIGKPFQVAQGIPTLLDANKKYYFSINITEVNEKEDEDALCVCSAGETA